MQQTRMCFPKQDCYCRFKMSQPMPTVHPFNGAHKPSQSKYWRYRILGACPAPTGSSGLQAAGRPGLPHAPPGSPTHVFPASGPGTLALLWEARRAEEAGWLAGSSYSKSKHTGMELECARTLTHTHTPRHTHLWCVHMQTLHSIPLFLCSCFTLQICESHWTPGI